MIYAGRVSAYGEVACKGSAEARCACDRIVTGIHGHRSNQMQRNSLLIICRRLQLVADVVKSESLQFAAIPNTRIHNPKVGGSSPPAATNINHLPRLVLPHGLVVVRPCGPLSKLACGAWNSDGRKCHFLCPSKVEKNISGCERRNPLNKKPRLFAAFADPLRSGDGPASRGN